MTFCKKSSQLVHGAFFLSLVAPALADEKGLAHAAYPRPFSRPPSQGKSYDTWRDASGPDVGEVVLKADRLPSRVDNAKRAQYPPVYKQKWGTCGQHAAIASVFTYEMNVLRGTTADSDVTRFPAYFSWNMMNEAKDGGSEAYHGWEVAKRLGVPTSLTYGGSPPKKLGVWPNGYKIWREAMEYRVLGYRYSPVTTIEQLNEARGWMFDRNSPDAGKNAMGGIFAMDGRMGELNKVTVKIAKGEYAEGEELWTRWGPSGYGHGLTCVGYDDEVGYDLNGDGKITNDIDTNKDGKVDLADWERGAYIVVNSWGEKWSGDGRIYLLYSAMIDADWERGNYLGRVEVGQHTPRLTLRVKFSCNDRSDLRVSIGMATDPEAKTPTNEFAPEVLNGWPVFGKSNVGHVPMVGPEDPTPIEMGIDLTELREKCGMKPSDKGRLFLNFSRADGSKAEGKLDECAVRHYDEKGGFVREEKLTVEEGAFGAKALKVEGVF